MNKDDYAKYITRKEIVKKFIGKLDQVSMEDTELLPALMRFIENGDERQFKEFSDYHFLGTVEEKRNRLERKEKELDTIQERLEKIYKTYNEKEAEYEEWCKAYTKKLKELPNPMGEVKPYFTLKNLSRFCNVNGINDTKYIYVMDENGNQYKVVGCDLDDKGKLVLKVIIGNDKHETPEISLFDDPFHVFIIEPKSK